MSITYIIVAIIVLLTVLWRLYLRFTALSFNNNNKISLAGKTVLVTGANTGIGYETALECAKRGARVIVACRDEAKGRKAVETITRLTQNKDVVLKLLDLASLKSVRIFAEEISKTEKKLDILINNAGCFLLEDEKSEDGFQLMMQVNHIAPALLTLLLLDLIKNSSPSRIVNVSSLAAKRAKDFTAEKINDFNGALNTYSNTKLGNIFFTQILAKKLKNTNVSVFSLHPGVIKTELGRHNSKVIRIVFSLVSIFLKDASEGCQTTLYTALEPDIEHLSGSYFSGCKAVEFYPTAKDPANAQQIWDATLKMIKFDDKNI